MRWIRTRGGPLLCIEKQYRSSWRGAAKVAPGTNDDYALACAITDYCSVIDVRGIAVVIFGDMPLDATVIPMEDGALVIRPIYAENIERICEFVHEIDQLILAKHDEITRVYIKSSDMLIFDSAYSGSDAPECIEFIVKPNKYCIYSGICSPDLQTSMIVHRFMQQN